MNKLTLSFFLFITFSLSLFTMNISENSTVLVVFEEQENNKFVTEATPFSDGIFNGLWEKECIFFDIKINTPIKITSNEIDVSPYLNE